MKRTLLALATALIFAGPVFTAPVFADCVLRQSDAVEVTLGPYVDSTDGNTAETGLTISQGDVILKKCAAAGDCGASAQKNDSGACAHDANGFYECDLNATDTDTVGILEIWSHESGALPVFKTCAVVEEAVYDLSLAAAATGGETAATIAAAVITAQGTITGTCDSGSTTTCVDNALTQANATQLEDRLICFDDSWCGLITTFTPASDTATTTKVAPSTRASKVYTIFPSTQD